MQRTLLVVLLTFPLLATTWIRSIERTEEHGEEVFELRFALDEPRAPQFNSELRKSRLSDSEQLILTFPGTTKNRLSIANLRKIGGKGTFVHSFNVLPPVENDEFALEWRIDPNTRYTLKSEFDRIRIHFHKQK